MTHITCHEKKTPDTFITEHLDLLASTLFSFNPLTPYISIRLLKHETCFTIYFLLSPSAHLVCLEAGLTKSRLPRLLQLPARAGGVWPAVTALSPAPPLPRPQDSRPSPGTLVQPGIRYWSRSWPLLSAQAPLSRGRRLVWGSPRGHLAVCLGVPELRPVPGPRLGSQ